MSRFFRSPLLSFIIREPRRTGMTLVEVLLSIAILTALFLIVTSSIDIGDIFGKLSSTTDETGVREITRGITAYRWDHEGNLPVDAGIGASLKPVCKGEVSKVACDAVGGVYLESVVSGGYLTEIPVQKDFLAETEVRSGFQVQFPVAGGRLRVVSPSGKEFVH
ncbi:MAG: prepilin-type N-terminal cleavage/methylation domain-containing protein [Patescibacteria group bacterium]